MQMADGSNESLTVVESLLPGDDRGASNYLEIGILVTLSRIPEAATFATARPGELGQEEQ